MITCPGCGGSDVAEIRITTTEQTEEYAVSCADCGITWPADWITESGEPPVHAQPMFMLKSVMDAGEPMRVAVRDYRDPGRWWL